MNTSESNLDSRRRAIIDSKLQFQQETGDRLKEVLPGTRSDYESDWRIQTLVERLCQVIVECAMDVNVLLTQSIENTTPQTGREGFDILRRHGIVSQTIHDRYKRSYIGFRNLVVHVYDKIDPVSAYYTAKSLLPDARQYAKQVRKFLDSLECDEEPDLPPETVQVPTNESPVRDKSPNSQEQP